MTAVDIFALVITGAFVLVGLWRGFVKSSLRLCALIVSVIIARLFGGALGRALLPNIIKSDSISSETLAKINGSISSVIGTLIVFIALYLLLTLLAKLISTVSLGINNTRVIRIMNLISTPCWLVYNICMFSIGGICSDLLMLTSLIIAVIRLDIMKHGEVK